MPLIKITIECSGEKGESKYSREIAPPLRINYSTVDFFLNNILKYINSVTEKCRKKGLSISKKHVVIENPEKFNPVFLDIIIDTLRRRNIEVSIKWREEL